MATRAIWKGAISFGLVNVPVTLHSGEEPAADLNLHQLDKKDHARIRYQRVNESTGKVVPYSQIVKGYEYSPDHYVLIEDKDFDRAEVESTHTIEISDFVDEEEIDPIYIERPYYLVPAKAGTKSYVLLREALKKSKKVGIAKIVIRTREHLAAVVPREDALLLLIMRFHHEVREADAFDLPTKGVKTTPKEVEIAQQLIEAMSSEWKPEQYHDEYRDALVKLIKRKAKEGDEYTPPEVAKAPPASKPSDLMELLRRSLEEKNGKAVAKK